MAAELPKPLTPHDFFKLAILESWPVLYIGLAYGALSLIQQLLYPDGKGFFLSEIFVKWGFWKWVAIWAVMFMVVAFYCAFSFSRDLNKKLIEVLTPRVSVAFDQNMMFDEGDKKIACITLTGLSVKTAENIEVYCVGAESIKLGRTLLNLKTGPASTFRLNHEEPHSVRTLSVGSDNVLINYINGIRTPSPSLDDSIDVLLPCKWPCDGTIQGDEFLIYIAVFGKDLASASITLRCGLRNGTLWVEGERNGDIPG